MQRVVLLVIALLGAGLAHNVQRINDEARRESAMENRALFIPSPEALKVASLSFEQQVGDLLWVHTILTYGDHWDEVDPVWMEWLYRMIIAVIELDPEWRSSYFYGGIILRTAGDMGRSSEIFKAGGAAFPEDHFFPFSVGMNNYLADGPVEETARWLKQASELPGAPEWYAQAAHAFMVRKSEREVALRYLNEELRETSDPKMREALQQRIARVEHDGLCEVFDEWVALYKERTGRPPEAPGDLVGPVLNQLPPEPLGGEWVLDVDGHVRSSRMVEDLTERARRSERRMLYYLPPP